MTDVGPLEYMRHMNGENKEKFKKLFFDLMSNFNRFRVISLDSGLSTSGINVYIWSRNICTRFCCVLSCTLVLFILSFVCRADSRIASSQRETLLQSNTVSHWLGANLESALVWYYCDLYTYIVNDCFTGTRTAYDCINANEAMLADTTV